MGLFALGFLVGIVAVLAFRLLRKARRRPLARLDATADMVPEAELRRLTKRQELILQFAGDGIYGCDRDGRITFVNPAACRLMGYERAEMIGADQHSLIHHSRPDGSPYPREECPVLRALSSGEPASVRYEVFWRRDGEAVPVAYVATPIEEGGEVVGAVVVFHDVSARLEAEAAAQEREEIYRQMFERNTAVKLLIDPEDGRIIDANPAAADFYGYPLGILKGMRITDIDVLPADQLKAEMERARREQQLMFRFRHRIASGEIRDVEVYSGPVTVRGKTYLHSIIHDVTERTLYARELEAKSAALERSNAELQQFAYVVSHDLQEPLRMIASFLQLLERQYGLKLDEQAREYVAYAVDGAKRMNAMINDLLQFSRVQTRGRAPKPVAAEAALHQALANLRAAIDESGAEVTVEGLPTVEADSTQLVSLFQNLIGNAIKYRHPDRPPRIRVFAERHNGEWVLAVADNGIGIEPEYFERVFNIFQRLHPREAFGGGTGMGLAICKRIVERHGGRIWVESTPGEGSIFRFTLPVTGQRPASGQEKEPPLATPAQPLS